MLGAIDEDEEEEFSDPVSNECSDLAASSGPKNPPAATSHTILVDDGSSRRFYANSKQDGLRSL